MLKKNLDEFFGGRVRPIYKSTRDPFKVLDVYMMMGGWNGEVKNWEYFEVMKEVLRVFARNQMLLTWQYMKESLQKGKSRKPPSGKWFITTT